MPQPYRSITAQTLHYYSRPHQRVPRVPIVSEAAWYGGELRHRQDWIHVLSAEELAECETALSALRASGKALQDLRASDFPLPLLTRQIADWRRTLSHGRGFVLIRGLPVERWGEADCERFFWCLGWHLGLPGAQNRFGELLGHVCDTGVDPNDPSVREYRTNVKISFHCDAADVVGLLCLKTARRGGDSRIASSVTIFNELLKQGLPVERLFQPFQLDAHAEGGLQTFPVKPCRFHDGVLRTFYHSGYFRSAERYEGIAPLTPDERALLDAYDRVADDPAIHLDMSLQSGDIQLCSNHTIVHSRTAYEDHADPDKRRHLLRLWLSLPEPVGAGYRARKTLEKLRLIRVLLGERWRQRGRITHTV